MAKTPPKPKLTPPSAEDLLPTGPGPGGGGGGQGVIPFNPTDPTEGTRTPTQPKPKPKPKPDKGPTFKNPGAPPVKAKGPPGTPTALKLMAEKYPNFAKYLPTIKAAAKLYDTDPVQLYSVLVSLGSRGNAAFRDNSGGLGLARISWTKVEKWMNPSRYADFVRKWGNQAYNQAEKPNYAINFLAWALGGSVGNYADADAWLAGGARQSTSSKVGRSPYQIINPEGRRPVAIQTAATPDYQITNPPTIPDKSGKKAAQQASDAVLRDPYVAGVQQKDHNGKATPGGSLALTYDINKAMEWYGQPVTRSTFLQVQANWATYYTNYTGKPPTINQIGNLIKNGWTDYTLINILSKGPNFTKSPVYKTKELEYSDAARDLLPKGMKVPAEIMRQAIVNGVSIGGFQESLRRHGFYEQSNEFMNNYGVLTSSYRNIMGVPDANGEKVIKRATKLGWSQPTFEMWLRKTPAYKYSPEYQSKVVGFLDAMGMFIGARAQLTELTLKQMANVPTSVSEGGKDMKVTPPLDLMPYGRNPMLKATFPYTSTPTPPSPAGIAKEPYKNEPIIRNKPQKAPPKPQPKRTGPYAKKPLP